MKDPWDNIELTEAERTFINRLFERPQNSVKLKREWGERYTVREVNGIFYAYGLGCQLHNSCFDCPFPDCKWVQKGSAIPRVKDR